MADIVVSTYVNTLSFAGLSDYGNFIVTPTGTIVMPGALPVFGQVGLNIHFAGYVNFHSMEFSGASTAIHIAKTGVYASTYPVTAIVLPAELRLSGANASLLNEGSITSIETALASNGTSSISNFGLISGKNIGVQMNALVASTGDSLLNEGTIRGQSDCAIALGHGEGLIVNHGTIAAIDDPGNEAASGIRAAGFLTLVNSGRIEGGAFGLLFQDAATGTRIQNAGTIHGTLAGISAEVLGSSFVMYLTNTGTISGEAYSFLGGGGADILGNSGTMVGSVVLGAGDDGLTTSRGTIIGNVYLGDGQDQLRAFGARLDGDIYGGTGFDTYFVDSAVRIVESFDFGDFDRVFARCDFELGQNVEGLYLQGLGNFTGRGSLDDNDITGNSGNNGLFGLDGNDTIAGGAGDDITAGGAGNDRLNGNDGEDALQGGIGTDNLRGDDGEDVLTGGAGKDTLTGGTGADRFVFAILSHSAATQAGADIVTDFTQDEDVLDLSGLDANRVNALADDAFTFIGSAAFSNVAGQLRFAQAAGNTFLQLDVTGDGIADAMIRLNGLITLNAGDFAL